MVQNDIGPIEGQGINVCNFKLFIIVCTLGSTNNAHKAKLRSSKQVNIGMKKYGTKFFLT